MKRLALLIVAFLVLAQLPVLMPATPAKADNYTEQPITSRNSPPFTYGTTTFNTFTNSTGLYYTTTPTEGLVGHWSFDEGSGTSAYDLSGNGNTGTLYNSPTWTTGKFGGALSFDGVNDYVRIVPAGSLSGTFSVAAWAKPLNATAAMVIVGTRYPIDQSFDMKFQAGNLIHGDIGNGSAWITTGADTGFNYQTGVWYHVVYVVTPTGYSIYVNGNLAGSGTYASSTPLLYDSNHNIFVGQFGGGGDYFNGSIDDVRIYNRALSADEISDLYAYGQAKLLKTGVLNGGNAFASVNVGPVFHLAYIDSSHDVYYARGTISGTTITLGTPYLAYSNASYPANHVSMTLDSNGYVWLGVGATGQVAALKNGATDGTWSTALTKYVSSSAWAGRDARAYVVDLLGGKVGLLSTCTLSAFSMDALNMTVWTGSAWTDPVSTTNGDPDSITAVADTAGVLHIAYASNYPALSPTYVKYFYSNNSFSAESILADVSGYLAVGRDANTIFLWQLNSTQIWLYNVSLSTYALSGPTMIADYVLQTPSLLTVSLISKGNSTNAAVSVTNSTSTGYWIGMLQYNATQVPNPWFMTFTGFNSSGTPQFEFSGNSSALTKVDDWTYTDGSLTKSWNHAELTIYTGHVKVASTHNGTISTSFSWGGLKYVQTDLTEPMGYAYFAVEKFWVDPSLGPPVAAYAGLTRPAPMATYALWYTPTYTLSVGYDSPGTSTPLKIDMYWTPVSGEEGGGGGAPSGGSGGGASSSGTTETGTSSILATVNQALVQAWDRLSTVPLLGDLMRLVQTFYESLPPLGRLGFQIITVALGFWFIFLVIERRKKKASPSPHIGYPNIKRSGKGYPPIKRRRAVSRSLLLLQSLILAFLLSGFLLIYKSVELNFVEMTIVLVALSFVAWAVALFLRMMFRRR